MTARVVARALILLIPIGKNKQALTIIELVIQNETCPKGFGLKLANLRLKTPLKSQAEPS